jgi:hypothetical protein
MDSLWGDFWGDSGQQPNTHMISKYAIDYILFPEHNKHHVTHRTDDPVEAEEFLMHLLVSGARIVTIRHEGVELVPHQFDRMVKVAAERLIVRLLRSSLQLDGATVHHRFGFAA